MSCTWILRALVLGAVALATWAATPEARSGEAREQAAASGRGLNAAHGLLQRGLYDLAAQEYRQYLAAHAAGTDADVARYGLAVCLVRQKQSAEALPLLTALGKAEKFAYGAERLALLAECALAERQFDVAAEAGERFAQAYPKHALAGAVAAMRIEALFQAGQHATVAQLARAFAQEQAAAPERGRVALLEAAALVALKKWDAAQGVLDNLKSTDAEATPEVALLRAQVLEQRGDKDAAVAAYRAAGADDAGAQTATARYGLARLLVERGTYDEAGKVVEGLLAGTLPDALRGPVRLLQARVWVETKDYARAVKTLAELADDAQVADAAAYWRGKCALRQGENAAAAKLLGEACERFPKSALQAEMQYDRGLALVRAGEDDAARQVLMAFCESYHSHALTPEALHLLVVVAGRQHDRDACRKLAGAFLTRYAKHALAPATLLALADAEAQAGDFAAAAKMYADFGTRFAGDPAALRAKYGLGVALYRGGEYEAARAPLEAAASGVEKDSELLGSLLLLGDLHYHESAWEAARAPLMRFVELADKAAASQPASGAAEVAGVDDALLKLGLVQVQLKEPAAALAAFERLARAFPKSPLRGQALFERGQVLMTLERWEDAGAAFEAVLADESAVALAPQAWFQLGTLAQRKGDAPRAAECFAKAGSGDDALQARAALERGRALLAAGDFQAAAETLRGYLETKPAAADAAPAQVALATALARLGQADDVLKVVAQAERGREHLSGEEQARLLYEKAWAQRQGSDPAQAQATYATLLKEQPKSSVAVHARVELAELQATGGDCAAAAKLLAPVIEGGDAPADLQATALFRAGVCALQADDADQAATLLTRFLKEHAGHGLAAAAQYYAGEALARQGQHKAATEQLTAALDKLRDAALRGPALLRLGESLVALQQWPRAEETFARFLRELPEDEHWYQAQFGVGWARENLQRYGEAITAYEAVVARHQGPTAARAQFQIGECLFAEKKLDEAVRALVKVDILYAYPEWQSAALFEAGRALEQQGKTVEARQQYEAVRTRFGETRWAKLADERLKELRGDGLPGRGTAAVPVGGPVRQ